MTEEWVRKQRLLAAKWCSVYKRVVEDMATLSTYEKKLRAALEEFGATELDIPSIGGGSFRIAQSETFSVSHKGNWDSGWKKYTTENGIPKRIM